MSVRFVGGPDNARTHRDNRSLLVAVAVALSCTAAAQDSGPIAEPQVLPGIDVWAASGFAPLAGQRLGLITNSTGISASGRSTIDILLDSDAVQLTAVLSPEHGLEARLEGKVDDSRYRGLPVFSLYGDNRRPSPAMLEQVDALVFDVQDVGARFYTYATTMAYCLEVAAEHDLPIVVLDRPNPISGTRVSGPVLEPELRSFVGYASIPTRHGMTLGELAGYFNTERNIGARLHVIPAQGWRRDMWFDQTGLLWIDPSPNIRSLTQATLYPAVAPIEQTNVSVGRGTDAPFEWLGAPWIEPRELAAALNAHVLPGVRFVARRLTPEASVHAGLDCGGVNLILTDRDRFDAGAVAAALVTTLHRLYPDQWDPAVMPRLWGSERILEQLERGLTAVEIVRAWQPGLREFLSRRQNYLLYP